MKEGVERITMAWEVDRGRLLRLAQRIVRDRGEAEEVVAEAFARLNAAHLADLHDVGGWLTIVVRNIALDRVGSAHTRLSRPMDPVDLAEQRANGTLDPADRVTLDEEIQHALGVVLERLTPAQRTSFLLHDVFGVPFTRIAEIVGRTPGACRQLASTARHSVRNGVQSEPAPQRDTRADAVAKTFIDACRGGDLDALIRLLDPSAESEVTANGQRIGWTQGALATAKRTMQFLGPNGHWQCSALPIEDGPGLMATRSGRPVLLGKLDIGSDGRITRLRAVVLPHRG